MLDSPWSVKDSFRCLDLEPLGLRPLFDADWIWTDAPAVADAGAWPGRVAADHDARPSWNAGKPRGARAVHRRIAASSCPELLGDTTIAICAAYQGDVIVAGCAANRSAGAVGFSNFFVVDGDEEGVAAAAIDDGRSVRSRPAGRRLRARRAPCPHEAARVSCSRSTARVGERDRLTRRHHPEIA